MKSKLLYILFLFAVIPLFAQETEEAVPPKEEGHLVIEESLAEGIEQDPLAPARAAFYSAVVPGMGQAYNKRYWKIPIVYAGMASGIYFYSTNNKDYNRFRDAYKRRLAGFKDDEFYGNGNEPVISNDRLINAQRYAQKNRNLSVMVTVGFYLLNIIDANVDAHLKQYEVFEDLTLQPSFDLDPINSKANYGMMLTFSF